MEAAVARRGIGLGVAAAALTCVVLALMVPIVSSRRVTVGANGWNGGLNYTLWAQNQTFHMYDWLFFVYDRNQMNVLEVNETDYETCNDKHPLRNWSRGAGRDVVPLNLTGTRYFISGNGFCYAGAKLAVTVGEESPPPKSAPTEAKSDASRFTFTGQFVIPAAFAIAAVWDSILLFCW